MSTTARVDDSVIRLVRGGQRSLAHLSDTEVLANARQLAGTSNKLFAALLVHLAEVETRGIHRTRSCASLYTYCIYELRMSEDEAARRSSAARLVKAFPALFDAINRGELHLTGLLMLGPHLTLENHLEVLGARQIQDQEGNREARTRASPTAGRARYDGAARARVAPWFPVADMGAIHRLAWSVRPLPTGR